MACLALFMQKELLLSCVSLHFSKNQVGGERERVQLLHCITKKNLTSSQGILHPWNTYLPDLFLEKVDVVEEVRNCDCFSHGVGAEICGCGSDSPAVEDPPARLMVTGELLTRETTGEGGTGMN